MLWSILIAAIPERYHTVQPLLYSLLELQGVARIPDIELLILWDNKRRTVGDKRNALLSMARGEYVSWIDDDDSVSADYVSRIHRAIAATRKSESPADVICFEQHAHLLPHGVVHECRYSLVYYHQREPEQRRALEPKLGPDGKPLPNVLKWTGPPAHTMVWRRSLVADLRFPQQQFGEDVSFVDLACQRARAGSEIQLEGGPLYHYNFDSAKSETRG